MEVKVIKGIDQIGGCITEIKSSNTRIIIDFGEELDDSKKAFELDGLTYGDAKYDAVFITHSHGDHIGLINNILENIPVYVEEKSLLIHNMTCDFCNKDNLSRNINTFKLNCRVDNIKPIFENPDIKVTPYIADHSSFNSCMYLIEGEGKRILHTGDFRNHGRKGEEFNRIIKSLGKVDLLITEGTTLTRSKLKFITEEKLESEAKKIIDAYDQVFIMQSSTNIDRTVSFLKASIRSNKKFVLDMFSYWLNKELNFNIIVDYKKVFVWKPIKYESRPEWFKDKYMNIETSPNIFPNFVMEVKESMLPDIRMLYKMGKVKKACLIYSMWDGYIDNEKKLKKFIDELDKMNIDFKELHTSGHADIDAMRLLNECINPDKTIIIHTDSGDLGKDLFNNVLDLNNNEYYDI